MTNFVCICEEMNYSRFHWKDDELAFLKPVCDIWAESYLFSIEIMNGVVKGYGPWVIGQL